MENISGTNYNDFAKGNNEINNNREMNSSVRNSGTAIVNMIAEGGDNFFRYLKNFGLNKEKNLMVLSSSHHYYYDETDLRNIKTLVNLKKLNMMKHLDIFLQTLFRILPQDANFVGCFSDSGAGRSTRSIIPNPSGLFDRFINFLDSKTYYQMNKVKVAEMLEAHGFEIIDMTELNGVTYFYSRNVQKNVGLRA